MANSEAGELDRTFRKRKELGMILECERDANERWRKSDIQNERKVKNKNNTRQNVDEYKGVNLVIRTSGSSRN